MSDLSAPSRTNDTPRGPSPRRRRGVRDRGTVLLMVVAVLALLAIIAVVFSTVGRADKKTAAALKRDESIDVQVKRVADHFVDVISRDATATHVQQTSGSARLLSGGGNEERRFLLFRQTTDYPWTDPAARVTSDRRLARFDPAGSIDRATMRVDQNEPDPIPSDPWLSSFPLFLGNPADAAGRRYNSVDEAYLDQRDYLNISNFGPDGLFVNLFALRNSFAREPGFGGMSAALMVFGPDGRTRRTLSAQEREFPFFTSSLQRGLFRPAIEDDEAVGPASPFYLPNSFADADGDGFYDSRWSELTDVTDPANVRPILSQTGSARFFIAARALDLSGLVNVNVATDFVTGPGREFRRDQQFAGGLTRFMAGESPADVDLRRLLMLRDFFDLYGQAYNGFNQPVPANLASNYQGYTSGVAENVGHRGYDFLRKQAVDRFAPADLTTQPPWLPPDASLESSVAGGDIRTNYDAIFETVNIAQRGGEYFTDLARARHFREFGVNAAVAEPIGYLPGSDANDLRFAFAFKSPFGMADEAELRARNGINDPERLSRLEWAVGGRLPANDNFSPLRDNRSLPTELDGRRPDGRDIFRSPAYERAALQAASDIRQLLTTYSKSRPLSAAASLIGPIDPPGRIDQFGTDTSSELDRAVRAAAERSAGEPPITVAPLLRTLGARLPVGLAAGTNAANRNRREAAVRAREVAINTLFRGACEVLLPFSDRRLFAIEPERVFDSAQLGAEGQVFLPAPPWSGPWANPAWKNPARKDIDTVPGARGRVDQFVARLEQRSRNPWSNPTLRSLFYGHNPELAIRMAAHWTANLVDIVDGVHHGGPIAGQRAEADQPTALTLRINKQIPRVAASTNPFDTSDSTEVAGDFEGSLLDLDDDQDFNWIPPGRLPRTGAGLRASGRVNIFGVDAQPFLVEVGAWVFYTDSPSGSPDIDPDPTDADPTEFVTINGQPSTSNDDFLCEVVAFQLTNPFDQDVEIFRDDTDDEPAYWVEFNGVKFPLKASASVEISSLSPTANPPSRTIRLRPRESVVFYSTYPSDRSLINTRFLAGNDGGALPDITGGQSGERSYLIHRWAEAQFKRTADSGRNVNTDVQEFGEFAGNTRVIHIEPDSTSGAPEASVVAAGSNSNEAIYLWRNLLIEQGRDIAIRRTLADRIHIPTASEFPSQILLPSSDSIVTGAEGGVTGSDNGLSVSFWWAVRRPTWSPPTGMSAQAEAAARDMLRRVIPPWCIETKFLVSDASLEMNAADLGGNSALVAIGAPHGFASLNSIDIERSSLPVYADGGGSVWTDGVSGTRNNYFEDLAEMVQAMLDEPVAASSQTNAHIGRSPYQKSTAESNITAVRITSQAEDWRDSSGWRDATFFDSAIEAAYWYERDSAREGDRRNLGLFKRTGDLLLPLAIGPEQEFFDIYDVNGNGDRDEPIFEIAGDAARGAEWTTLAEALAMAQGYFWPQTAASPYHRFGYTGPGGGAGWEIARVERGRFVTGAFVPFIDDPRANPAAETSSTPDGVFEPDTRRATSDRRIGMGIPLAQGFADRFRAQDFGAGDSAISGMININTAPPAVLRIKPMLSPTAEGHPVGNLSAARVRADSTWGRFWPLPVGANPQAFRWPHFFRSDIAATVAAYRDKNAVLPRGATNRDNTIDMSDYNDGQNPQVNNQSSFNGRNTAVRGEVVPVGNQRLGTLLGPVLREERGFISIGEILNARTALYDGGTIDPSYPFPHNIDRLGFDGVPTNLQGIDSLRRTLHDESDGRNSGGAIIEPNMLARPAGNDNTTIDIVNVLEVDNADDGLRDPDPTESVMRVYDESLQIANSVLNMITTRSDTFVVWFLVHGYTRGDVTDLGPGDPLVPSIARRYVMIVDRSNVNSRADKGRIVMLQEVPVE